MVEDVKFIIQPLTLPIQNLTTEFGEDKFKRHSDLFGGNCKRCLLVGASGSGKTNVMLSLLIAPNGLRFLNVYLCSSSLYQMKYEYLRHLLKPIRACGYYECSDAAQFITPAKVKEYSIIIFDDISPTEQNSIKEYFSYGRHKNVDCFYLAQSYSAIPKQLVRDNCNLLVLFKQDLTNLKHIFNDHLIGDITWEEFIIICKTCWDKSHGVLVIDLDCEKSNGRYRKGFDEYIVI